MVPVAGLEWMSVGESRPSLVRFGAKGAAGRFFVGRVGSELSPKPYFEGIESHHSWVFGARAGIRGMLFSLAYARPGLACRFPVSCKPPLPWNDGSMARPAEGMRDRFDGNKEAMVVSFHAVQ